MTPSRQDALEQIQMQHGVDLLLLDSAADVRWVTGFTGSNALVLYGDQRLDLLTDGRYTEQARSEVSGATIHIATGDLAAFAATESLIPSAARVAFDPDQLTVARHSSLCALFPGASWVPASRMLSIARARKDAMELAAIRKAQALTEAVFLDVAALLRPGMTEHEVAAEIVARHLRGGADGMSFEPIVASGPNSARPHARPTDRPLAPCEPVLLDFGCFVDGYASDMTRMVALGEPGDAVRQVHASVQRALAAATSAARGDMPAAELDHVARAALEQDELAVHFSHGLGHGVGLAIHEWPAVSYRNDASLPVGAVVTLEPGVYLAGRFGVRIEDMVQLTHSGCDRITSLDTELLIV